MDPFEQRKKDILSKTDKSNIGKWDDKIISLCEKINSLENYYTTSSCAGRIVIIKDEDKKGPGLFEFVSHDLVYFEEFLKKIKELKGNFKFKQEPPILHVACRTIENAKEFLEKGLRAGFKRSGIISLGKNIVVELNGTDKIEFPLIENLSREFLEKVIEKSNSNLEKGWKKLKKLEKGF